MNPLLSIFIVNILFLLVVSAIGFGIGIGVSFKCKQINFMQYSFKNTKKVNLFYFLSKAKKLYGDHCRIDSDCSSRLNYECQSGVCNCTSTTFYKSASEGCGWFLFFLFKKD